MEGKAALFKHFAGIDAWPICLDSQDTDEIVRAVQLIAPGFGGINLEDISAPRCFEVERRLRGLLDIPVFHDDQHGTAIVVMAALTNALRVVGKKLADVRITMAGAGAAGTAVLKLLLGAGATAANVVVCDDQGAVHQRRPGLDESLEWIAEHTNRDGYAGDLAGAMRGADVFIGLSAPGILSGADIAAMAPNAVVFALANPDPEVDPDVAMEHAAVVATGRSDYPNQINNVLAFPGVFRGLLDAQSPAGHRRHAGRRRAGARGRGLPGRDRAALHHSLGVPPRRSLVGGGRSPGRRHPRSWPMIGRWTKKLWRACCSSPPRCWGIPISAGPSSWLWSTSPSRAVSASC